jgi:hypothetical protein
MLQPYRLAVQEADADRAREVLRGSGGTPGGFGER